MVDTTSRLSLEIDSRDAERQLDKLDKKLDSVGKQGDTTARQMSGVSKELTEQATAARNAGNSFSGLGTVLTGLGGVLAATFSVGKLTQYADTWSDLSSRVSLAIKPHEQAADVMARLSDIAEMTYSSFEQTAESFATNSAVLQVLGKSTQEQLDYTEALNNALVVSGAKSERAAQVQYALSKAMATGKLSGEELNSVLSNGGRIATLLAEELGTNTLELRALGAEGKITGEVIYSSLTKNMQQLADEAEKMPATIGDAFQILRNAILQSVGVYDQANKVSSDLAETIVDIGKAIRAIDWEPYINAVVLAAKVTGIYFVAIKAIPAFQAVWSASMAAYALAVGIFNGALDASIAKLSLMQKSLLVVAAGAAGWEFGTYMRENFEGVEKAGIALASGVHQMAIRIQGWLEVMGAEMKFALTSPLDFARGQIADFLTWVNGLGVGVAKIFGLDGVADKLKTDFSALRGVAAAEHKKSMIALKAANQKEIQVVADGYFDMFDAVGKSAKPATKAVEELKEETKKLKAPLIDAADATKELADETARLKTAGDVINRMWEDGEAITKAMRTNTEIHADRQKELNAAFALGTIKIVAYTRAMADNDKTLQDSIESAATLAEQANPYAKLWENAVDRIDASFADMFKSAFKGTKSLMESIKSTFQNLLAEMAYMAVKNQIMISIGMNGSGGGGGIGSTISSLVGGSGGGSGGGLGSIMQMGSSIYSAFKGWGAAAWQGYQAGGFTGAISGIGSSIGSSLGSMGSTIGGWFGSGAASAGTSAGTGFGLGGSLVSGQAGSATYATGASSGGAFAAAWPAAVAAGIIMSGKLYDKGVRADGKQLYNDYKDSGVAGNIYGGLQGVQGKINEFADKIIGSVTGGKIAAMITGSPVQQMFSKMLGDKLFGGAWKSKDTGIALGVQGGELNSQSYNYMKKKGGLFSSSKKKTKYGELDAETNEALGGALDNAKDYVEDIYKALGFAIEDGALSGLNIARTQISTKGKTEEQINEAVTNWFAGVTESISGAFKASVGAEFDYTTEDLANLAGNLGYVNDTMKQLSIASFETSLAGAELAKGLNALFGGDIAAGVQNYYAAFYSSDEQLEAMLKGLSSTFESLGKTVPQSRKGFRDLVESLDLTDVKAQETFAALMGLSGGMSEYYAALEQLELGYYAKFTPLAIQNQHHLSGLAAEFSKLGMTMPTTRQDFSLLVDSLSVVDDASAAMRRALLALAPAMDVFYASLEQFDQSKLGANASLLGNIGGLRENIFMDQLDAAGKYNYAKSQADALSELLPNLADLQSIMDVTGQITQLTQQAYGVLDDEGKKTNAEELIKFLDETQDAAQEQIKAAQIEQTEQQAKIMADAMLAASERMAENMEKSMLKGADAQTGAAKLFGSIMQQFANTMAMMAMSTTGEVN